MSCCSSPPAKKPGQTSPETASNNAYIWLKLAVATILAGLSMYLSLGVNISNPTGQIHTAVHSFLAITTLSAILLLAGPMFVSGWNSLRQKNITLEHAFLIGIIGAFCTSIYSSVTHQGAIYYEVVIVLIAIYLFGQTIKSNLINKHQNLESHIPGLFGTTIIRENGTPKQISIQDIQVGDTVIIKENQIVPTDCRILTGTAYIEQQAHTGETFPQPKSTTDTILAGSTVLDGKITATAITSGTDRQIDHLLKSLSSTTDSYTKSEVLAQRILNIFVPSVLTIAILTGITWTLLGNPLQGWLNALTVTVVACPCALGIAIPLAIRRGLISLSTLGIVPKNSNFIDQLADIDHVAFDKTGTLSNSTLELANLELNPHAHPHLKDWIIQIQKKSTHPVARPFWKLQSNKPSPLQDLAIQTIPGRGIKATFSQENTAHEIIIGNNLINQAQNIPTKTERTLYIFHNKELAATATLTETVRAQSTHTLQKLHDNNIKTTILTGDTSIPKELNIPTLIIKSGLTSTQKADHLKLTEQTHNTLYIGDGLNDCEGFQIASISLALDTGNQAAKQIADATILHDDLSVIPQAITMAKNLKKNLNRTLLFSFIYNATGITLAALGLIHPVVSAILMFGASIFAISFLTNSKLTD